MVVVIGAGHNGLAAAATLVRAGRPVTVLEARDVVGGICAGEAFHPGFSHQGLVHDTTRLRPHVAASLAPHGLTLRDAPQATLPPLVARIRDFAVSVLDGPAPRIGDDAQLWPLFKSAVGLRRLGDADMMALLKVGPMSARDWVQEFEQDPQRQADLCAPWMVGAWMGPWSPAGVAMLLHSEVLRTGKEVVGGPAALVTALEAACSGATIRTEARVTSIDVKDGAVTGVRVGDEYIKADTVLSCIGPRRTLLDLVHPSHVHPLIERDVADIRVRGTIGKVHIALKPGLDLPDRGLVAESMRVLEQAFDDAKHRRMPRVPALDVRVLDGKVLSAIVLGCAHDLDGGWTDAQRDALQAVVVERLAGHFPGLSDHIEHVETLTPADIAERYGLEGGHPFHGEHALDQLYVMRPTAALAQHQTPIKGLYLGSAGTHPGGYITCGPGTMAARAIL